MQKEMNVTDTKDTPGEVLLNELASIVDSLMDTAKYLDSRMEKICVPDNTPEEVTSEAPAKDFPIYLAVLSNQIDLLRRTNQRLRSCIDRCEI